MQKTNRNTNNLKIILVLVQHYKDYNNVSGDIEVLHRIVALLCIHYLSYICDSLYHNYFYAPKTVDSIYKLI